jgi:hypothetical protein
MAGNVAQMGRREMHIGYCGKAKLVGRPSHRWEDNI